MTCENCRHARPTCQLVHKSNANDSEVTGCWTIPSGAMWAKAGRKYIVPSAGQVIGWGAQPRAGGWSSVVGRTNNLYAVRGPGEVENIAGIALETIIKTDVKSVHFKRSSRHTEFVLNVPPAAWTQRREETAPRTRRGSRSYNHKTLKSSGKAKLHHNIDMLVKVVARRTRKRSCTHRLYQVYGRCVLNRRGWLLGQRWSTPRRNRVWKLRHQFWTHLEPTTKKKEEDRREEV